VCILVYKRCVHPGVHALFECKSYCEKKFLSCDSYFCIVAVAYPEFFFSGGGSRNSVDRGQTEQESGGGSPLVRGSAQFANR
jgi:hypothetical protein